MFFSPTFHAESDLRARPAFCSIAARFNDIRPCLLPLMASLSIVRPLLLHKKDFGIIRGASRWTASLRRSFFPVTALDVPSASLFKLEHVSLAYSLT